jgi:UDP-N-acetylmuramoyl-L-alanyl-D-glutamate--2,6-diaminopimelate ligase
MAKDGDIVLLAGKGHESYQLINGVKEPFSERIILTKLINDEKKAILLNSKIQK